MSTLEKTINLLNELPERQLEIIYSYAQFVSSQQSNHKSMDDDELNSILNNIVGVLPDTGKSLEDYRKDYEDSAVPVVSPKECIELL